VGFVRVWKGGKGGKMGKGGLVRYQVGALVCRTLILGIKYLSIVFVSFGMIMV